MNLKKLLAIVFIGMFCFWGCQKDETLLVPVKPPTATAAEITKEKPTLEKLEQFSYEAVEIVDKGETLEKGTVLYENTHSLSAGQAIGLSLPKWYLHSNRKYWIETIPTSGDPDVYVVARPPTRLINYSEKGGLNIDAAHARGSDIKDSEDKFTFIVYGYTNCSFTLKVYYENDNDNCPIYNVPMHTQNNNWSCGHNCVRIALDYYGTPPSLNQLYNAMGWGLTNADDREDALNQFSNLDVTQVRECTFGHLKDKVCNGAIGIVDIWRHNLGHSVVVTRIDHNERVYFNDPWYGSGGGQQSLSKSQFLTVWDMNNYVSGVFSNVVVFAE